MSPPGKRWTSSPTRRRSTGGGCCSATATRTRAASTTTRPTWRTGTATRSSSSRRREVLAGPDGERQPQVPRGPPDLHGELAPRPGPLPGFLVEDGEQPRGHPQRDLGRLARRRRPGGEGAEHPDRPAAVPRRAGEIGLDHLTAGPGPGVADPDQDLGVGAGG